MLKQFQHHVQSNFPFLKGKKLLITVSGGIDSVVLTHLLTQSNFQIGIAHCNFQLRADDSNKDELFVHKLAEDLKTPWHFQRFNTKEYCKEHKVSTQIGARELRYQWFQEISTEFEYDYILTAHHLNDVIETFFINLSRGTGLDGLTSIPAINNNIIRPLLVFSRQEIENYAFENGLSWREDKSNAETKYLRNKIRHHIVPEFRELTPNFEENFKKTLTHLYQSSEYIQQKTAQLKKQLFTLENNTIHIDIQSIKQLSTFEIHQLFKEYHFTSAPEIIKLTKAQTGKELFSKTHKLLVNRTHFLLVELTNYKEKTVYTITNKEDIKQLPIDLVFSRNTALLDQNSIAINLKKNDFPFILRKRKDGDIFYPTGMTGKKKVSKYLKDIKLSKLEKEDVWILCNSENKVIWIVGFRADRTQTDIADKENVIFVKKQ